MLEHQPHRRLAGTAGMGTRRGLTVGQVVALFSAFALWANLAIPGPFKAFTYAIPFLALMAMLSEGKAVMPPQAPPYLVLIVTGIGLAPLSTLNGWQDLFLMLIGISPFAFGYKYQFTWRQVFFATVFATLISVAMHKAGGGGGGFEFSPMESKSSFESPTSFVFGLLALWAAIERRWGAVLLAMLLCILTLKRIMVIAVLVSIAFIVLPAWIADRLLRPLPMLAVNAVFLVVVVMYTRGTLDPLISAWTHQSANQLGMGRQALYFHPVEDLMRHTSERVFYGVGAGTIYDVIKRGMDFFGKPLLHNDSLKILVEYGGLVWIAFFCAMFRRQPLSTRYVMIFLNVVLLTDNTLVYPFFIYTLGLVVQNTQSLNERGAESKLIAPYPATRPS